MKRGGFVDIGKRYLAVVYDNSMWRVVALKMKSHGMMEMHHQ